MSDGAPEGSRRPWGRVLVITPTYNEFESLERVLGQLLETVPGVDILVVDDSSPDSTGALADRIAAAEPRVHVLHRSTKDGLGRAYLAGFAWAEERGYDIVVEMDADGSHPAAALPEILGVLVTALPRPGLVIGSRYVRGGAVSDWPRRRIWLSRSANAYARTALRIPVMDVTAGYRAYPIDVVSALAGGVGSHGYSFQIEMTVRVFDAGYPILEVPIVFHDRTAGTSKMSRGIVLEAMAGVTKWGLRRRFGGRG